jgi:hypothetical protein
MNYTYFKDVPIGAIFGPNGEWRKTSTRTARYLGTSERIFYFRQLDLVEYRKPVEYPPQARLRALGGLAIERKSKT